MQDTQGLGRGKEEQPRSQGLLAGPRNEVEGRGISFLIPRVVVQSARSSAATLGRK